MTLPETWLLGATITFSVQWAINSYENEPFNWFTGIILNLIAWPIMLAWTLYHIVKGMVGR